MKQKQKGWKSQGKGNKKNRKESPEADEIKMLYKKQLLGAGSFHIILDLVQISLQIQHLLFLPVCVRVTDIRKLECPISIH